MLWHDPCWLEPVPPSDIAHRASGHSEPPAIWRKGTVQEAVGVVPVRAEPYFPCSFRESTSQNIFLPKVTQRVVTIQPQLELLRI